MEFKAYAVSWIFPSLAVLCDIMNTAACFSQYSFCSAVYDTAGVEVFRSKPHGTATVPSRNPSSYLANATIVSFSMVVLVAITQP